MRIRLRLVAAILVVVTLAVSMPADAKIAFRGPSSYFATGSLAASVAIGDLDRDGIADLVVPNNAWSYKRPSSLSILKGKGDGTFEPYRAIPVDHAPQTVVIEDLDGDDLLDLIVSHYGITRVGGGSVSVILGNGDGTFRPATVHAAGDRARSLRVVDIDDDGDRDLVTENVVLLGDGQGSFGAARSFAGYSECAAAVGDLDRDGRLDVVTANYDAENNHEDEEWLRAYAVRLGNGDGTFRDAIRYGAGFRCTDAEVVDLDGDGLLDLAVVNHGDDRGSMSGVLVHRGRGDGTFDAARLFPTAINPMTLAVADLDGDEKLDLVTANCSDDPDFDEYSLTILLGKGDGTFVRRPELHAGSYVGFVAVGRLDADAASDLVAVNAYHYSVSVFLGNGDGSFGNPDQALGRAYSLTAADFDQDGRTDLAASSGDAPGGVRVLRGRGNGTFGDPLDTPTQARGAVRSASLDGDHVPDLLVSNETGISVLLADGDGTFREADEIVLDPLRARSLAIADFDLDGSTDLAVPQDYGAVAVSIVLGRGDGSFGSASRFETGPRPQSAAAGDLNGDGVQDLVVGLDGFNVSVLIGHGDGTFAPHVDYGSGNYFSNSAPVGLADVDEDGHLDVVNGNLVRLGNGDGTLRAATPFDIWTGQDGLVLEDLDGDHHVDLVTLNGGEQRTVSVYRGRGDGTFEPRLDYGTGRWPLSLTAGDFDGDGRTDLAVANHGSSSISLYLNRSQAPVLPVRFGLRPAVVNARADARWVTGILETPAPHAAADVDLGSIRLNGVVPVDRSAPGVSPQSGSRELVLRFDRAALAAVLPAGDAVPVTITGRIANDTFEGTTNVRVLGRGPLGSSGRAARHALRLHVLATARADANGLRFGITLAEDAPARLDVIDVAGRVVVTRSLESLASGPHEIEVTGTRDLSPGIYFVRLRQGPQVAHARTAILR